MDQKIRRLRLNYRNLEDYPKHVLATLGTLGSLAGGSAGIAKAVSDVTKNNAVLTKLEHNSLATEGSGLFLEAYKGKRMKMSGVTSAVEEVH